ncbi:MAG: DNA-deoxyinosine glycosylase [Sphingobium sp.]
MEENASLCFPPVAGPDARLLILGSLPGVRSLELTQYYGHPRNHFWHLVGGLIGIDLPALPYEARLDHVKAHGLALWDVVAQAVRPGSLDQHLRSVQSNDLEEFIATLPRLRAIAFNGATASRIGRRQLASRGESGPGESGSGDSGRGRITLIDLPSTSPANTMALARKAEAWSRLKDYIGAP